MITSPAEIRARVYYAAVVCLFLITPHSAPGMQSSTDARLSLTDSSFRWPQWDEIWRTVALKDYNTRVVVIGTTLLGIAAGVIGTFAYLRKRAMMGDALSHATLPGIALVFLLFESKDMPLLLVGAACSGVVGVLSVIAIRKFSRLKEDAAIGIVLSVFFGIGMVLFSLIQQLNTGNEAGLTQFIYGKAASMISRDAQWIAATAGGVMLACHLFYKEFRLVCFDSAYASAQGWPTTWIDVLMMALVVLTTVIGLQAVGLIMIVALLIIPAATARFWTERLSMMVFLAALFGALSGWWGCCMSALLPRLPAGAIIVLVSGALFLLSMCVAPRRGVFAAIVQHHATRRKIGYQNLLRAMAELEEQQGSDCRVLFMELLSKRTWTSSHLRRLVRRALRRHDLARDHTQAYHLTDEGRAHAARILRNYRMWELFLIRYADIAPGQVDRGADRVEHVLAPHIIDELERVLESNQRMAPVPN